MKITLTLLISILALSFCLGQKDMEIIKIKNADRSVSVSLINHSQYDYEVKIHFELQGMKVDRSLSNLIKVPADSMVLVCNLLPIAEQTNFKISCKASQLGSESAYISIKSPEIILYSKNKHEASTQIRNHLKKNEIDFLEHNVSYSQKSKDMYNAMLERRGLLDIKIKLPVVIIKGEIFYNIKDIDKFIDQKF